MRIAMIASEVAPFSKTGGLADVLGALPAELAKAGHDLLVISPLYRDVRRHPLESTAHRIRVPLRSDVIHGGVLRSGFHYFLEHNPFYDRDGLYGTPQGDYPDNAARFYYLSRGGLSLLQSIDWKPDIIHVHDWQSALAPVYMRTIFKEPFARTHSVLTIHNLAFQGLFWHWDMPLLGLDWSLFNWKQLEFYGKINFLKGGIVFSDAVTTVSPTYAREIRTSELGHGLEGVLRERSDRLYGILNGVDYSEWSPETDRHLPARYSAGSLEGKAACKKALQERCGLEPRPDVPVLGMVARLADQKGIDIFIEAVEYLVHLDAQIVVVGTGDARYEQALRRIGENYRRKMSVTLKFDESMAHLVEAGADFFLMPSRYEPCGLNQMYSLRYGTLPIVRRTGGLADTVVDRVTGFSFEDHSADALVTAVQRALAVYRDGRALLKMQRAAMKQDFSWARSAQQYLELYERLSAPRATPARQA